MAVHMIRVVAAVESTDTPGMTESEINTALDDWVSKQSEWGADPVSHNITISNTNLYGPGVEYYRGDYRFELTDAKDNLLTKCEDKLKDKVDWYRLGYHVCDHDEDSRGDCNWDDVREFTSKNASIPSEVPSFS